MSVLSSEPPCEPKSLDVALHIARVEKIPLENLWLRSAYGLEAIWFEFWMKDALVTVEILSSVIGDSQISLM